MKLKHEARPGILYIIATPIGNLQDITIRALTVLRDTEVLFVENLSTTIKLLKHYNIVCPTIIEYHDHNENARVKQVVQHLRENKIVAMVSDAGTPLISDPGFKIVQSVKQNQNFRVTPIPGVSAMITALSAGGVETHDFLFKRIFAKKKNQQNEALKDIKRKNITTILYESKHRIIETTKHIANLLPDNKIVIARELTKRFECFFTGTGKKY